VKTVSNNFQPIGNSGYQPLAYGFAFLWEKDGGAEGFFYMIVV
jgi:hypothetical protein